MSNLVPSWRPAGSLLTPNRLDLIIKARAFRALLRGEPIPELYDRHIMARTGGREPGSWKQTVADYHMAASFLLSSMQIRQFNRIYPVKLNRLSDLVAGAHRLACALVLELDVAVVTVDKASPSPWDSRWLMGHGFAPEIVEGLRRECEELCLSRSSTAA